jgi:tetratricopeptide (TPR) repeat protein
MTPRNLAALLVTASLILPALPAFAQKAGTTGAGAGSSTGTTGTGTATGTGIGTTNPGSVGVPGSTGNTNTRSTGPSTPIYLTGRVAMDDGSALPGPVTIERVCNGATHTEGYTDMKGTFGIQLGNEAGVFQDATDAPSRSSMSGVAPGMGGATGGVLGGIGGSSGMGGGSQDRMLMNCELRAKLPGFRSQSIMLAGRRPMDDPDLGTILMHREAPGEGGSTVSATTLNAPKAARKAFEKGQELLKKNKPADAREEFEKAVQIDQAYAAAWCELGKLQAEFGDANMARGSFRVAMKSDPKFIDPYLQLSMLSLNDRKWQETADLTDQVLRLNSFDYPQAYLFNAAAKYNMQEVDAAEKSIKEADRLDTRHQFPEVAHLYGAVLQYKKDYAGAVLQYRAYLKMAPDAEDAPTVRKQLETLDKLTTAEK